MREQQSISVFSLCPINIFVQLGNPVDLSASFCWLLGCWGWFFVIAWFITRYSSPFLHLTSFITPSLCLRTADTSKSYDVQEFSIFYPQMVVDFVTHRLHIICDFILFKHRKLNREFYTFLKLSEGDIEFK